MTERREQNRGRGDRKHSLSAGIFLEWRLQRKGTCLFRYQQDVGAEEWKSESGGRKSIRRVKL